MADRKYNIDNIVSKYIHRPIIKGYEDYGPLYARISMEGASPTEKIVAEEPKWTQAIAVKYNSPTNVRRLIIGDRKVAIQYYQPVYNATNTGSKSCWVTYSIKDEDVLSDLNNKNMLYDKAIMRGDMGAVKEMEYRPVLTKTGLGALSNNWIMSNIEEVYITSEILMSIDIRQKLGANAEQTWEAMRKSYDRRFKDNIALEIFEMANGNNIKNIRTRFPRLRLVALAHNLDAVMVPNALAFRDGLPKTKDDISNYWYKHILELGLGEYVSFIISPVPFGKNCDPILDFSIRPGIYKYDDKVLAPYFESYKEKVKEIRRQERYGTKEEQKVETKKSEYEEYLDKMLEENGENIVRAALQLATARMKTDALDELFGQMSTDGAKKYRDMIGR